ncbi:MAG: FkbM family methyltransferase [Acidobacteriota bacterium]
MKLYGDSIFCRMVYFWDFEIETRQFLKSILSPGDVFLDVGANVGLFSLIAARCVGANGQVHAFEPVGKTYERLVDNVKVNRLINVTCHRLALSDKDGEAVMTIATDGHDAWNSLGKPYMGDSFDSETIITRTLDSFLDEYSLLNKVKAIKVDVEGWEAYVLAGGMKTLSSAQAPLIIVEFTEEAAALANSSCSTVYDNLKQLGYQMFRLNDGIANFELLPPLDTFPNINVIATKNPAELNQHFHQ